MILPSSVADEQLCLELLQLFVLLIEEHQSSKQCKPGSLFAWLSVILLSPKAAVMGLLQQTDHFIDNISDHHILVRRYGH